MPNFEADSVVVERVEPSPNFDERTSPDHPDILLLHYTGMQRADEALQRLCDPVARVSSHYFVFENGSIAQLVPEQKRAWHAGVSSWEGETDINSRSIGIEIANPGHEFGYRDFPSRQIAAVTVLCRAILRRHAIRPDRILAHSDVAPGRKQDPGEKFPWRALAHSGIGLWVEPSPITPKQIAAPGEAGEYVKTLQKAFGEYGYGLEPTGQYDAATKDVVTAFQRHYRQARIDGIADQSTLETLQRLLEARNRQKEPKTGAPPLDGADRPPHA
jgi:N-acetylmuramoyl-L-alanine amidase